VTRRKSILFVLALGIGWALLDQVAKFLVVGHLTHLFDGTTGLFAHVKMFYGTNDLYALAKPAAAILSPVWNHQYVQNPAGAFGLLHGTPMIVRRLVFTGVALAASVGILWMAGRAAGRGKLPTRIALGLVLGGAIGNLTDRIVHGYVIDFIDWHISTHHWPSFNVADVGIVVGVFSLLFLLNRKPAKAEDPEAEAAAAVPTPTHSQSNEA